MSVSDPGLKNTLQADLKTALKGKNTIALNTLRLVLSEIKNEEIAKQAALERSDIEAILRREVRKRHEAIDYYQRGLRDDLVNTARREISILEHYLPSALDPSEIELAIDDVLSRFNKPPVFGQVMKQVMVVTKGQAEGKMVAELVRRALERRR